MIKNPYLIIGLIVAALGLAFWLFHHGEVFQRGKDAVADVKGVNTHAKIEHKTMSLPDADLDRRFARWLR